MPSTWMARGSLWIGSIDSSRACRSLLSSLAPACSTAFSSPASQGARRIAGTSALPSDLLVVSRRSLVVSDCHLRAESRITRAELSPTVCSDAAYLDMWRGRMVSLGMRRDVDGLKRYCAKAPR